jgi:glycosyltransferase involved in cell wall biosynthesis
MIDSLVSIITPFYNSEKYIRDTLESVLAQSYPYWEMICVDDCSQDQSTQIVEEYSRRDNRIKLVSRKDSINGPSHCRNLGIIAAKGKYCMFLDSDDLLIPTCLKDRVKAIENTEYKIVVMPMASFTERVEKYSIRSTLGAKHYDYYFASSVSAWPITSTLIRCDYVDKIGAFDETLKRLEDVDFHLRAILYSDGNYLVMRDRKPDCFYRITSIQNRFVVEKFEASQQAFNDYIRKIIEYKKYFKNLKLFSKSILTIMLHVLYVQSVVDIKKGKKHPVDIEKLMPFLLSHDKLTYNFVNIMPFTKLRLVLSAILRKLILRTL